MHADKTPQIVRHTYELGQAFCCFYIKITLTAQPTVQRQHETLSLVSLYRSLIISEGHCSTLQPVTYRRDSLWRRRCVHIPLQRLRPPILNTMIQDLNSFV